MTQLSWLLLLVFLPGVAVSDEPTGSEKPRGVIARSYEDGLPVLYKFVDEEPTEERMRRLPWLAIITWKYDGSANNGMPPRAINEKMLALEDAVLSGVVKPMHCEHAISRTGNNLKELLYYINDRDEFIASLNSALESHPRYPIEITFHQDPKWIELQNLRSEVHETSKRGAEKDSAHPADTPN